MSSRGICRCCLSEGMFKSLTAEYRWLSGREVYGHMLMECFGLSMTGSPENEQQICEVCITRLRDASNFKKQVVSAEQRFRRLRLVHIGIKSEPEDITLPGDDVRGDGDWVCEPDLEPDPELDMKLEQPKMEPSDDEIPLCDISRRKRKAKSGASAKHKQDKKGRRSERNENTYVCVLCGHPEEIPCKQEPEMICELPCECSKPVCDSKAVNIEHGDSYCKKCPMSKLIPCVEATPLRCDQNGCKASFRCLASLKKHQKTHHKDVYDQPYYCRQCPEWFASRYALYKHNERHSLKKDPKAFQCGACEKVLTSKESLIMHQRRTHLMERPFACSQCEYRGYSKVHLKDHMISHTGRKQFTCGVCNKMFARRKAQKLHMRIHNNDKRAVCKICGQAFVQRASLTYHMTKHHPSEPM